LYAHHLAVFIPGVISSHHLFTFGHIQELLVTKVFFAVVDPLDMETKASKTITLHEDRLDAATNLGINLGVTLESLVDEIEFGRIKRGSAGC
jgi:hypothetical protein